MSESYQMQTIVQEDLMVYYTLIFCLPFAFQVHCSEKSQVSLDTKRLLSRILTFVFIIFPSPERMFAIGTVSVLHPMEKTPVMRRQPLLSCQFRLCFYFFRCRDP